MGNIGRRTLVNPRHRLAALVRLPLGLDARNSLTRMAPAKGFSRPTPAEFGMGSVGEGGSVGLGKTCYASSNYAN